MSESKMLPKEYIETQMRILEMAKIAGSLDIDTFLLCISNAETVAPMIDPTLFMKAQKNLTAIKKLALIAKDMKAQYAETFQVILETALAGHMKKLPEESNILPYNPESVAKAFRDVEKDEN